MLKFVELLKNAINFLEYLNKYKIDKRNYFNIIKLKQKIFLIDELVNIKIIS